MGKMTFGQVCEAISLLEKEYKKLNDKVDRLIDICSDLNNDVGEIRDNQPQKKSIEEQIILRLLSAISKHINSKVLINELLLKTGFVSLCIDNGKAFLYAVNPMVFLADNNGWNFYQKIIEYDFHLTLCLGQFYLNIPNWEQNYHLFGVDVQHWIKDWMKKNVE